MTTERLIFTDELIAAARAQPEARRRLIQRWALFDRAGAEECRFQLEAAAALVPVEKRPRVIGPLIRGDEKQTTVAAGVLLLAKVLTDQGWIVEHEPEIAGVTPDLAISKGGATFLVEARQVVGDFGLPSAYPRLQAELAGIQTRTPVSFSTMEVDGGASLRGFRKCLLRALEERPSGPQQYREPGIFICFELHLPPLDFEMPAFFGHNGEAIWFDDAPSVRTALDEKLKKYQFPLIVALQGIDTGNLFGAAEDVLYGSRAFRIPISHATGGPAGPTRLVRRPDSVALRRGSDGDRVRDRLEGLLPFELGATDRGFTIRARLLANPAKLGVEGLEKFQPIPSVLHLPSGGMSYVGADGQPLTEEDPIADEFLP
jgi:hypothetical protein